MKKCGYGFRIFWSAEDQAFVATCPEFDGVSAAGPTAGAALAEAQDALQLMLETYASEGWDPPEPRLMPEYSGQFRLRIPSSLHERLVRCAEDEGVSLNTWAVSLLSDRVPDHTGGHTPQPQ